MTVSGRINHDSKKLCLEDFPICSLEYTTTEPNPAASCFYTQLKVRTSHTEDPTTVFVKNTDLQHAGLSLSILTARLLEPQRVSRYLRVAHIIDKNLKDAIPVVSEHLREDHLNFFTETPHANRDICKFLYEGLLYQSKIPKMPGIYKNPSPEFPQIFINLKKTQYLGEGTYGRVRKALFLNPPSKVPTVIAKKVLHKNFNLEDLTFENANFENEMRVLRYFHNKTGIIKIIAAGSFEKKRAIFMPIYDCSLYNFITKQPFHLSTLEKLQITSQLLEGLSTISKAGIHGDLKSLNILINKKNDDVQAVISDFGAFRCYRNLEHGLTTRSVCPPEYFREQKVSAKHDVWGMGISLFELFSEKIPFWINDYNEAKLTSWVSNLFPRWSSPLLEELDAPYFIKELINQMLNPRENDRLSPREAFEFFSTGYASYLDSIAEEVSPKKENS